MSKESKKRKQNAESSSGNDNKKKKKGHWAMSMLNSVDDPQLFVEEDEKITVIKDKYPKAEIHFLVIPKEDVSSIKAVTAKHLPLLEHMEEVAYRLLERNDCKNKTFRIGYHAEPSMVRLHLHMLSDDMNSPFLKTKKHWNSFNTDFFLLSKNVCKQLKENGKIELPSSQKCTEYLNSPLKCNKCEFMPKNMPELKRHLLSHSS